MPIKATNFVWENEPKKEMKKLKESIEPSNVKQDDKYIFLSKDRSLKVEKSQYTMDMMDSKGPEDINKKNNL